MNSSGNIYLYSPIPPMKTGTANYLSLLVDRLLDYPEITKHITIVVDYDFLENPVLAFRGIAVKDFRSLPSSLKNNDLCFFFVANNIYHGYVARVLSQLPEEEREQVISIVHEPCTFMLLNKLCGDGIQTFSRSEQLVCLSSQYGAKSEKLLNDLNAGHLPSSLEFLTIGMDYHLKKSAEIWCHSAFAISKFILESSVRTSDLPRFRLVSHPLYRLGHSVSDEGRLATEISAKKGFRIGLFGWCSPNKMIVEFLRGFSLFLDRRTIAELENVELIIVGQMYPESTYPLKREISRLDLKDYLTLYDYVDDQAFSALVRTCDLIGNLRYPSCGESSGTLSHAHDSGAQIITTNYQSFAEEVADYRLPISPLLQPVMISAAIDRCYNNWATQTGRPSKSVDYAGVTQPALPVSIDKLLLLRCAQFIATASAG